MRDPMLDAGLKLLVQSRLAATLEVSAPGLLDRTFDRDIIMGAFLPATRRV
jgi:hypothetical protein